MQTEMRTIMLFVGMVAALAGAFWIVFTVMAHLDGGYLWLFDTWRITTAQSANFTFVSACATLVAFTVSSLLGLADEQLKQIKKTNQLLTQLIAQSGRSK